MLEESGFINGTDLVFTDISSEDFRVYEFEAMNLVRIEKPLRLHVSASGGHRIFDAQGFSHYIPSGWRRLMWKAKPGQPNFVK